MARVFDPASIIGKTPVPQDHIPVVVIGAGPAGLAAACAAAQSGCRTMLVDENPVSGSIMGLDVPLHFGQRMGRAVQNKARMLERIIESDPAIADAFNLSIDVKLGTYVWGAVTSGPTIRTVAKPLLGLADEEKSWVVSFDRLIVAAGARDLGMSFAGWEKPGVMGAMAMSALVRRYQDFIGRRILVLGTGAIGLQIANLALDAGLEVVGIVDVCQAVRGSTATASRLAERGVQIYLRYAIKEARGKTEVEDAILVRLDERGAPIQGSEITLDCDTIVIALGAVPNIELLSALGCDFEFDPRQGGYIPIVDDESWTTVPGVQAVGDCAGIFDSKFLNQNVSASEGAIAGKSQRRRPAHGVSSQCKRVILVEHDGAGNIVAYWQQWFDAETAASGLDVNICQCEEVTKRELVLLKPPRYLDWKLSANSSRDLSSLVEHDSINQDQIKRLTRAGMGPCQGRRCREQVQYFLAAEAKVPASSIPLATYRAPVRPLPLSVLSATDEPAELSANWVAWFNIPEQWKPHWKIEQVSMDVAAGPDFSSGK